MSYKSPYTDPQEALRQTPRFIVNHYRNIPQAEEDSLESFLSWLENNIDYGIADKKEIAKHDALLKTIKSLVNEYLGKDDFEKIKKSEKELLKA